MGNIVLLDDLTINKIAAGEVIERPASVVKEMVENSIDAGANNIVVEIKNGGISYIKISDNGKGIAQDDLEIAFERHATSKIRSAEDLDTVKSMGFRGEALASIAAVANVELISKTEEQETGYRIVVEAGNVLEKEEIGCRTGTTITVRNLFFNTPVRYKFLKKDYTESGYIEDVITRIALVNPGIAIKLINTGKTVIQTNGSGDFKNVIYSIYGKDIANGIEEVNYNYEDITVTGVIGKPEIARSNRSNQLFFVNKRYIKDKTLTAATEQAYKGLITIGKFGFVILNLEMDPSKVDVNVHPAKLEVRFQEENKVFQAIYHAIKDTLLKAELVKDSMKEKEDEKNRFDRNATSFEERLRKIQESKKENNEFGGLFGFRKQHEKEIEAYNNRESEIKTNNIVEDVYSSKKQQNQEETEKLNKNQEEIGEPLDTTDILQKLKDMKEKMEAEIQEKQENQEKQEKQENQENQEIQEKTEEKEKISDDNIQLKEEPKEKYDLKQELSEIKEKMEKLDDTPKTATEDFNEMYTKLFGRPPIKDEDLQKEDNNAIDLLKNNISMFENVGKDEKPQYRFVGIMFKTYIILEMKNEMYMIDQHAAHERVLYEKIKKNYYSDEIKESQLMLLPDVITLTHKEMDIAKENMEIFKKAGFMLEEFGENTIKLTGVPTVCIDLDTKSLFLDTLDAINTVARTAKQEKEERFIATVACKAAVKAGMDLTEEEVNKLMDQLLRLPNPFTCPHGRPTTIKMTRYDIERKFSRK